MNQGSDGSAPHQEQPSDGKASISALEGSATAVKTLLLDFWIVGVI